MTKDEALAFLPHLRAGTHLHKQFIDHLRRAVGNSDFSLADIGTSWQELETLRLKGCKVAAERWLKVLRDGTSQRQRFAELLRASIQEGNLSLADIRTDTNELKRLYSTIK